MQGAERRACGGVVGKRVQARSEALTAQVPVQAQGAQSSQVPALAPPSKLRTSEAAPAGEAGPGFIS